ncbi:MAG: repair protein RecN [Actinomycetota bacterium]|nr:repair protein RecN [Actinomycetota bacterium]
MISELSIRGLGVIESADIHLGARFTVLTGETGAGKTMVLTALGMLMGAKASTSLVRGERARVEGRWLLTGGDDEAARIVRDVGGEIDTDELILARVVPREGRARAFVGGASVPAAALAEISGELVAVHGQSEQIRIRQPARQRALLDAFAGEAFAALRRHYRDLFDDYQRVSADVTERVDGGQRRAAEAEQLRHGLEVIAAVAPQPGEDDALRVEEERLANVEDLAGACRHAHTALSDDDGGDDALARVGAAVRQLERVADFDPDLAQLVDRLRECAGLLADVTADVASFTAGLEGDPNRLAWVQDRRATLSRLTRTYGATIDEVLAWAAASAARLADLEGDDDAIETLRAEQDRLRLELGEAAEAMSRERQRAADRLAARVSAELTALAMPDATLHIHLSRLPDASGLDTGDGEPVAFGPEGIDQVAFLLAAHRGATAAPLGQGASGGELSRVMLALEVALAGVDAVPTMVFDEVDAGVGGRAAVEVGRRLARLARHTQVIVVTHLPQVAAFADTHLVVAKDARGAITSSSVTALTGDDRRRELARMLAGQEDSDHALAHADELLALGVTEHASGH